MNKKTRFKKILKVLGILTISSLLSCQKNPTQKNELISPYYTKNTPINWRIWTKHSDIENKKKLKFISIGYPSCFWCFKMDQDTFSKASISKLLNTTYQSFKVDREHLPEIDIYFQNIYQKYFNSTSGWPLNIILNSKDEVLWMGNYLNEIGLKKVLEEIRKKNPIPLDKRIFTSTEPKKKSKLDNLTLIEHEIKRLTKAHGIYKNAFNSPPLFPPIFELFFLNTYMNYSGNRDIGIIQNQIIKKMINSKLHDKSTGLFNRYSTNRNWENPHKEKMYYLNSQFMHLFLELEQNKNEYFKYAEKILTGINLFLRDEDGLIISSFNNEISSSKIDKKKILANNSSHVSILVSFYKKTNEESYKVQAYNLYKKIKENFQTDNKIAHHIYLKRAFGHANLLDLTLLKKAALDLWTISHKKYFYDEIISLTKEINKLKLDNHYYFSKEKRLNQEHFADMDYQNPLSTERILNRTLYFLTGDKRWQETFSELKELTLNGYTKFSTMLRENAPIITIIHTGKKEGILFDAIKKVKLVNKVILKYKKVTSIPILYNKKELNNTQTVYICKNSLCFPPITTINDLMKRLNLLNKRNTLFH